MVKVFVDGLEGTTGLQIRERLALRNDIDLLEIDPELRKDLNERKKLLNEAEYVFLCLPDDAARESVSLVEKESVKILDASTAHRTNASWAYGLPELSPQHAQKIKTSKRIAVPGCHASAYLLSVLPLVKAGILPKDYPITCTSITGFSGGGKKMIAQYEDEQNQAELMGPRFYALSLAHKHLPEMKFFSELNAAPAFFPVVGPFPQGLVTSVGLHTSAIKGGADAVQEALDAHYAGSNFVQVLNFGGKDLPDANHIDPSVLVGTNKAELMVFGNDNFVSVYCRIDNLGKGASGAAIQCFNIMQGKDETLFL